MHRAIVTTCVLMMCVGSAAGAENTGDGRTAEAAVVEDLVVPAPVTGHTLPRPSERRPAILPALYVASVGLHTLDAYSTLRALDRGAVEKNPLLGDVANNSALFVGVKTAVAAASIAAAERMWRKHHRTAAIVMMVASNSVMTLVVQHNLTVLRGLP